MSEQLWQRALHRVAPRGHVVKHVLGDDERAARARARLGGRVRLARAREVVARALLLAAAENVNVELTSTIQRLSSVPRPEITRQQQSKSHRTASGLASAGTCPFEYVTSRHKSARPNQILKPIMLIKIPTYTLHEHKIWPRKFTQHPQKCSESFVALDAEMD